MANTTIEKMFETKEEAYNEGISYANDEMIEMLKGKMKWYEEKEKKIGDVQICIVLDDFKDMIESLK